MASGVIVGAEFGSFTDLQNAIKLFEAEQLTDFYTSDSRTLENARKRFAAKLDGVNLSLKYYSIQFACKKGGRVYRSKSKGERPNQLTYRHGCPAMVKVLLSADRQKLTVKEINTCHNHPVSKASFQCYPKQRQLDEEEKQHLHTMLKTRPNLKLVQNHLRNTTGKMVTLRDLCNHKQALKEKKSSLESMNGGLSTTNDSVETCKSKWRTLRDGFTRALRQQREAKSGSASKVKKPWRYQTEMEFLIPFISSRESRTNALEQGTEGEDQDSPAKASSPHADSENSPAKASSPHADSENEMLRDNDDTHSTSSHTGTEPPLLLPVTFQSQNPASLKRHFEQVDSGELPNYIHCKRQDTETLVFREGKMDSLKSGHCQCRCLTDDPTEAFFYSMGQSVKRLPFYLQAQVKMKVCQLVTEAEMECLDSMSNQ